MMLTREQSRTVDRIAIDEYGMSGLVLMENAGRGVTDRLCELGIAGPVVICCGKGNNAGDGFVIARHLNLRGYEPCVLLWARPEELVGDAAENFRILQKTRVPVTVVEEETDAWLAEQLGGADWIIDAEHQRYRLSQIFRVPDWTQGVYPPLAQPGMDVREGDYLLAIDGQDVTTERNLYSYFQGLAGKQVSLLFNDRPDREDAREVTVVPVSSERTLRYRAWVEHNRRVVARASGGQLGYMHLPDTYLGSAREFPKYFYSQTQKKGLIIDGRYNGGGLDPDILLQRLAKRPMSYWTRRYSMDQTTPPVVTQAHLALLTNRQAGSGGDMLPMEFQLKKMGPVIGTRTWGGLVGISMFLRLIDGGGLTAPDYRIYSPEGRWIVENVGIQPDIVVDLDPMEMARGHDAQLMKGVEVLLKQIQEAPITEPSRPAFPADR